ncbi:restriction endonuclease subunit S [Shewanella sp. SR44-4]|uniref:restriction endonuclease subunit S n=1 Tax=Shewanella sp. SR44-4 TaxID=2760935 RepID=UPI0015FFD4CE|nr:restriction endonuclease subunit S [Shewanella sp. SR44-4]MBB1363115.1 restriction endonuclease subunit S [Shewanella sp. SR44-4]
MRELPKGWVNCSLGDVVDYGKTVKAVMGEINSETWILELEDIEKDSSKILQRVSFGERQPKSSKNAFTAGDVLYGKLRPYLNKMIVAPEDGICTSEIVPLSPPVGLLDNRYLFYWLKGRIFGDYVNAVSYGVNMPRLGTKDGLIAPMVLAPLAEQKRIVEKLDEVLAQVDTIKARLDGIPAILKRFRQSVLASAVSGKLTEKWRASNPTKCISQLTSIREYQRVVWEDIKMKEFQEKGRLPKNDNWKDKYVTPYIEDSESLGKLPDSWDWCTWGDILEQRNAPFKRGPFGSALKKSMFIEKGYKVYEQYCPINDDCSFARYFITDDKYQELIAFDVKARDFLISCSGVTLGRITQVPEQYDAGIINQALLRVRLDSEYFDDNFFIRLFRSEYFQKKIFDSSTGSAIPNVKGVKELKAIPVPLMGLDEQKEIVRLVDNYFELADTIEAQVKKAQARVDNLTQSILAKAFRGELVPQDSNDEPADKLLERIAQARIEAEALAKTAKKGAGSKKSSAK